MTTHDYIDKVISVADLGSLWLALATVSAIAVFVVLLNVISDAVSYIRVKALIRNLPGPPQASWFAGTRESLSLSLLLSGD